MLDDGGGVSVGELAGLGDHVRKALGGIVNEAVGPCAGGLLQAECNPLAT